MDSVHPQAILLVEDNPDDEALTLRALRKNNIANEVYVVRDGQEAVDFLFSTGAYAPPNQRPIPAVVLLDLRLPMLSGLEVLKEIRRNPQTRLLPVVIFTSSDEESDVIKSYESGVNSFVRKPVDFTKFVQAVGQLGVFWLLCNQAPPNRN